MSPMTKAARTPFVVATAEIASEAAPATAVSSITEAIMTTVIVTASIVETTMLIEVQLVASRTRGPGR